MKKSLLAEAISYSRNKLHTHKEIKNFIHFTFIVQNNKIVECGRNHTGACPKHFGYQNKDENFPPKVHSEVDAYYKAKGLLNKKPFELINVRLNRKGEIKLSKPCDCCHNLLKELGCSAFYYSSKVGFLKQ